MKIRLASVLAGAVTLAATGALVLGGAAAANAAVPPFQPPVGTADPNEVGTLAFYNASGTQIMSGSINAAPFAAFYVGSTADAGHTKATQYFYTPKNGTAQSAWPGEQASLSTTYPNTGAPPPINGEGTNPVVTGAATDESLATYITDVPNTDTSTTDGYAGLYEVRVKTSTSGTYQAADILVSGTTWTQVFPTVATATNTALVSSANPSTQGQNVTLTATESSGSSHPAGSVQFSIDGANVGSPVAVNSSGVATTATSTLALGTHPVIATFTPTDAADFAGSTSNTVSQVVNPPSTPTATSLALAGNTTTGGPATLSGTVTATPSTPTAVGSVEFFDNGSSTPIAIDSGPSVPVSATGTYTATLTAGFAAGPHSVVAKFTPTNVANFEASQSAASSFFTAAPTVGICADPASTCTDTQNLEGTIPVGSLVISTPYNGSVNALNVGTLALNSNGTAWTGSAPFQCIRVTDASSGGSPFVASAIASTLVQTPGSGPTTGVTSINGQDVGLTGLGLSPATETCPDGAAAPVQSYNGAATPQNNPAASPPALAGDTTGTAGLGNSPHTILTGTAGAEGTTTWDGTLTLNAPTSTTAGLYTGTVIFTVSD